MPADRECDGESRAWRSGHPGDSESNDIKIEYSSKNVDTILKKKYMYQLFFVVVVVVVVFFSYMTQ